MTTPTGPHEPWTDHRLEAAFATRASRIGTPDDLARTAVDRVRPIGRPQPVWRRLLEAAAVVALAVSVVGVLAGVIAGPGERGIGPSPPGPGLTATGTPTPSTSVAAGPSGQPPTEVMGLPVLTVEEAIEIRDAGRDDREIAVRGWFHFDASMRCRAPTVPVDNPLDNYCISLVLSIEPILPGSGDVPHVDVDIDEIERGLTARPEPTEIVAVGHFDDRRAGWCHTTRIDSCRSRLVVDRLAWVDGAIPADSVVKALEPVARDLAFDPVGRTVAAVAPDSQLLSASAYSAEALAQVEPSLRDGRPGITDEAVVWSVRVLQGDRAITYLVVDGTERVYELEADGRAVLVGGKPPEDAERTWPPEGVIDVPMPVGNTGHTPNAGVVDRTGLLVEARAAGEGDPGWPAGDLAAGEMSVVQAAADTIVVLWNGSMCDDRFVLTVYGDRPGEPPDRMQLRGERADLCRLAHVHYGMRLRFSSPVDARTMRGFDHVGTPFEAFPPVQATVVELPNDGGFSPPRVRAALIDLSGRITAVRLPRPDEAQPADGLGSGGRLVPDPSVPGRYQLAWVGGPCAPDIVITIDAALAHVYVTNTVPPDPPDCDTIAQVYRLILDIDGPLDPPAVEVRQADMSAGAS